MILQCPLDQTHMDELGRSAAGRVFECPTCQERRVLDNATLTALGELDEAENPKAEKEPELPTPQPSEAEQQKIAVNAHQPGVTAEQIRLETSGQMQNWNEAIAIIAEVLEISRSEVERRVKTESEEPALKDEPEDMSLEDILGCSHPRRNVIGEGADSVVTCTDCGVNVDEGWEEDEGLDFDEDEDSVAESPTEEETVPEIVVDSGAITEEDIHSMSQPGAIRRILQIPPPKLSRKELLAQLAELEETEDQEEPTEEEEEPTEPIRMPRSRRKKPRRKKKSKTAKKKKAAKKKKPAIEP